jgi:hypothetical protein
VNPSSPRSSDFPWRGYATSCRPPANGVTSEFGQLRWTGNHARRTAIIAGFAHL